LGTRSNSSYSAAIWRYTVVFQGSFPFLTNYLEFTLHRRAREYGLISSVRLSSPPVRVHVIPSSAKGMFVTHGAMCSDHKGIYFETHTVFAGRGVTATLHETASRPFNNSKVQPKDSVTMSVYSVNCARRIETYQRNPTVYRKTPHAYNIYFLSQPLKLMYICKKKHRNIATFLFSQKLSTAIRQSSILKTRR
jgi:hypothetical protein